MCKEPSVSSTFVMLSRIVDDIRGDKCRQTPARVNGVDKYEGKVVFKLIREASIR